MFNQPCHGLKATHKGLGACICRTVAMHGWLRGDAGRGAANSHDSPVPCFVCSVYRPSAHKNLIIRVFVNPSTSIHAVTSARFVALPLLLRHLPCMQLHRFSPRGLNRSVVPQRKGRKYAPVVRRATAAAAPQPKRGRPPKAVQVSNRHVLWGAACHGTTYPVCCRSRTAGRASRGAGGEQSHCRRACCLRQAALVVRPSSRSR